MLILFAAPFVVAAGFVFTILSLIPRARRWAIPTATGLLGAEPCFMAAFSGAPLVLKLHVFHQPAGFYLAVGFAAMGAIAGGALVWWLVRYVVCVAPNLVLRLLVLSTGWCSYFVVIYTLNFVVDRDFTKNLRVVATVTSIEAMLALIAAWFIARSAEQFRIKNIHLPDGKPFRKPGPEATRPAPDAR